MRDLLQVPLTLLKAKDDSLVSDGEDLGTLLQSSIPGLPVTITTVISLAAKITLVKVAHQL